MKNCPTTEDEIKNYYRALIIQGKPPAEYSNRYAMLISLGFKLKMKGIAIPKWLQNEENRLIDLWREFNQKIAEYHNLVTRDPSLIIEKCIESLKEHPFEGALHSVYKKYVIPARTAKRKHANRKLSEGYLDASRLQNY